MSRQGVFTLSDARSFFGLTSKNPPLGAMLNFIPMSQKRPTVTNVKTASSVYNLTNRFTSG